MVSGKTHPVVGLENLSVCRGFQQLTNLPVTPNEAMMISRLICGDGINWGWPNGSPYGFQRISEMSLLRSPTRLPFLHRARPVVFQQPRQRAIGKHFAVRLAARAVVGLVLRVDDALHRAAAHRAG